MTEKEKFVRRELPASEKAFLEKVEIVPKKIVDTDFWEVRPKEEADKPGLIIAAHGGGFCKGHREEDLCLASKLAALTGNIVYDLDYLLAPEHPFPAAFNQVYGLTAWAWEHADEVGFDRQKLILFGSSAGGNLVAAAALKANQTKAFQPALQILNYPPLDLATDPADKKEAFKSYIPFERSREYNNWYVDADKARDPYVSPCFASQGMLVGLPETVITTAGQDALHNEAEEYAFHLLEAGVLVTAKKFEQSPHGFIVNRMGPEWEEAHALLLRKIKEISEK